MSFDNSHEINVAIIGSGIIGSILALGLTELKIPVQVYEQAHSHREIGAGIAFTANARKCMSLIDPRLDDCVTAVGTMNGEDPKNPNNYMQFIDGYTPVVPFNDDSQTEQTTLDGEEGDSATCGETPRCRTKEKPGDDLVGKKLYKLHAGPRGFEGCHRAHFLDQVMKLMPNGVVQLGKRLENYILPPSSSRESFSASRSDSDTNNDGQKIKLIFSDGSTAEADIVIGCDGIKSRIRTLLFPNSTCTYSHKIAYRGLVPMSLAVERLGPSLAYNQHMYGGPKAHVLHFPVAKQTLLNIVAFVNDPTDWPSDRPMTLPATKEEVARAFHDWGATVRAVIDLLPVTYTNPNSTISSESESVVGQNSERGKAEGGGKKDVALGTMDKWAVFDAYEFPVPRYAVGRICIAGDAAHAAAPHHGAGAGVGVEDVLALVKLLEMVKGDLGVSGNGIGVDKEKALSTALSVFSDVRYERSQWLVRSSREVCETYEWNNPDCGKNMDKGFEDVKRRSHRIWYFDIDGMLNELKTKYRSQMDIS